MKVFGSLVKGLQIAMDLLVLLQEEDKIFSSLSKIFSLPELSGSAGLGKFLSQFEAAVDSEFPNYQVWFFLSLPPPASQLNAFLSTVTKIRALFFSINSPLQVLCPVFVRI